MCAETAAEAETNKNGVLEAERIMKKKQAERIMKNARRRLVAGALPLAV